MTASEMHIFPVDHFNAGDSVHVYPGYVVRSSVIKYVLLTA